MTLEEIRIRDPFFLSCGSNLYLYGTTDDDPWHGEGTGFDCYISRDQMRSFTREPVFRPAPSFWGRENFWAPEVRQYHNKFLMTASFKGKERRGVQILLSSRPDGPFVPVGCQALTPLDQDCLDGTLWFENNKLFLVYSHEWTQSVDGEICLQELDSTSLQVVGSSQILFRASDASWTVCHEEQGKHGFVTDGPFVWKLKSGRLAMIWSSFSASGYSIGIAYSEDGIHGPWIQEKRPLYDRDGGHGMIFQFQNRTLLAIHAPNSPGKEHVRLLLVEEQDNRLKLRGDSIETKNV